MNAIAEPPTIKPTVPETSHPPLAYPKGRWTVFKNPFHRPEETREPECRVQSEMRLETIVPVCNDLNESDLELFELNGPAAQARAAAGSREEGDKIVNPGAIWGKIVRGIFGSKD